jgi:Tfp pilus assembly PilM family ATPase
LEIERSIRAYVHGAGGREIRRVIITGTGADMNSISERLNARMQTPCECLPVDYGLALGAAQPVIPPTVCGTALAAAIPR